MTKEQNNQEKQAMQVPQIDLNITNKELREQAKDPTFWQEQWHTLRLIWRLLRDPEVPVYLKLVPLAAVVYLFVPIDILPDMIIGLGQLDDLTVLLLGAKAFTNIVPQHLVTKHRQSILSEAGLYHTDDTALQNTIIFDNDENQSP